MRTRIIIGAFFLGATIATGVSGVFYRLLFVDAANISSLATVNNKTPVVSAVVVNNGNPITLNANATTTITVSFTVSDNNGCRDVFYNGGVTSTLFRSGAGVSCSASTLNCYVVSTSTHNCPSPNSTTTSANATATFQLYYFADATDASSSYASQFWDASILALDAGNATSAATSTGVELNTLLALNLASSSFSYGTLYAGTDTSSTNQIAGVVNVGNSSSSLQLHATQTLQSGSNSIATTSQRYASTTFTYGGVEQQLQSTAQTVAGLTILRPPLDASWSTTTAMDQTRYLHAAVAHRHYLYFSGTNVGGSVTLMPVLPDGSLGSASSTTSLPTSTYDHTSFAAGNYLYILGGVTVGGNTSTVWYSSLNLLTGGIEGWATTTPFPAGRSAHANAVYNNKVYIIGGTTAAGTTSSVFFATMNATGSLGAWSSTTALPGRVQNSISGAYNGYLYSIGGQDGGGTITSTVYVASISGNGSLGSWVTTTPLPLPLDSHAGGVGEGMAYVVGGVTTGNVTTTAVYFAPLHADGSMGAWISGPALPLDRERHAAVIYNGVLYISGGVNAGFATSSIIYARLSSRNTYWGTQIPAATPAGDYSGVTAFTAVFSP